MVVIFCNQYNQFDCTVLDKASEIYKRMVNQIQVLDKNTHKTSSLMKGEDILHVVKHMENISDQIELKMLFYDWFLLILY